MTEFDLINYLTEYIENKEGTKICIDALTRYRRRLETFPPYIAKEYIKDIDKRIRTEEDELRKQEDIIKAWSELITNENARNIFVDHYIKGIDWLTIEDVYHYATSTVFNYRKRALTEITQKAVQDIPNASVITATSIL